jgi:hypothetical protein
LISLLPVTFYIYPLGHFVSFNFHVNLYCMKLLHRSHFVNFFVNQFRDSSKFMVNHGKSTKWFSLNQHVSKRTFGDMWIMLFLRCSWLNWGKINFKNVTNDICPENLCNRNYSNLQSYKFQKYILRKSFCWLLMIDHNFEVSVNWLTGENVICVISPYTV